MLTVTATDFMKNFGRHNTNVQREPIAVTNHGRVTGYYISAHEFEDMQKKLSGVRSSHTLETVPSNLWRAFMEAEVDPAYQHLDALLEESPAGGTP